MQSGSRALQGSFRTRRSTSFLLCDEIHALRALEFTADAQLIADFETNVRARFAAQHSDAQVAAAHCVEPWSQNLWWFKDNLPH